MLPCDDTVKEAHAQQIVYISNAPPNIERQKKKNEKVYRRITI